MRSFLLLISLFFALNSYSQYKNIPSISGGGGGASNWGDLGGTLSDQTDLQSALDNKLNLLQGIVKEPNNGGGNTQVTYKNINLEPLQNSPDESFTLSSIYANIDPDSSGFNLGTNGDTVTLKSLSVNHQGTSDVGRINHTNNYVSIGNGTDAISMKGVSISYGFGNINKTTITDFMQGYGFQYNIDSASTFGSGAYVNSFYDTAQINTAVNSYTSFQASPTIADVNNNNGVAGVNLNPTIPEFTGNASYTGFALAGQFGATSLGATSGISGINIQPTISNFGTNNYYNGVYSSVSNISGAGTNKWAGYFDGDVNITGDLSFGGALSIGSLTAYGVLNPVVNGGGNPTSVHSMISSVVVPANATTANADTIGTNTAMLLEIGDNSAVTLGALELFSALALPAVIKTGTGSNHPAVQGATFALSFDGASTGGTINQVQGGRFVAIPNGITTVNRFYGVHAQQPFGVLATNNWGLYIEDSEKNYIEHDLKVGGTDTLTETHFGIESDKTIASENGVQIATSGSQPTCDADHRGLIWNIEGGAGVADIAQICQKDSSNAYVWNNI